MENAHELGSIKYAIVLSVALNDHDRGQINSLYQTLVQKDAEIEWLRAALTEAETVMMIVEPRSHKAEYLAALASIRAALNQQDTQEKP